MAKEYRSWLLKKYPVLQNRHIANEVPTAVEIIGAVNKTQHRLGLPFDLPLKLTSYKEMESIVKDIAGFGWKNVNVKLNGWFNRSVEHTVPSKIKLIKALGGKKDFEHIIGTAEQNNFIVYPLVNSIYDHDAPIIVLHDIIIANNNNYIYYTSKFNKSLVLDFNFKLTYES